MPSKAEGAAALASQKPEAVWHDGPWARFAPALRRLDAVLARAVEMARLRFGEEAATDRYRGLHITAEQVERALAIAPGTPLLFREDNEGSMSGPGEAPGLALLSDLLGLDDFELDVIIITLAPELDLRYERIYSFLQDDVTRRRPTVDLVLNLLCADADERLDRRHSFLEEAPLLRHRLIELAADPAQSAPPLLAQYLRLDREILRWLFGQGGLDASLSPFCKLILPPIGPAPANIDPVTTGALTKLAAEARKAKRPLTLYFHGPAGAGRRQAAEALARALAAPLLTLDIEGALLSTQSWDRTVAVLFRQARLDAAVLYFDDMDTLDSEMRRRERRSLLRMAAEAETVVILAGTQAPGRDAASAVAVPFAVAGFEGRRTQWQEALAARGVAAEPADIDALAGRFHLTVDQIAGAVTAACGQARWRDAVAGAGGGAPGSVELFAAARAQSGHDLLGLARPIQPKHAWADIVLPADRLAQLHEICARASLRHVVYDRWGFDRKLSTGRGLSVLFAGPSGTGKTMAAEIIAGDLGLDLYKIDLSQIVSKYIGETEKNLDRIFQAAESANAILFFDEADALFGKRSEVKEAHDRHANIEVGYLLQKMDEYEGIAVLATNLRQNMDEAFIRRLHVIVEFPFPDEVERRRIWATIFPPEAPVAPAVDFGWLAREVRLSGGKIRNIALAAAFRAAASDGAIGMPELIEAARREYEKASQTWQPGSPIPGVPSSAS